MSEPFPPPAGQPPYGQPPTGQPPYGQPPAGQPPYGRAPIPVPVPPAPPGAYGVPVGGYRSPIGDYQVPPAERPPSRRLGGIALVAALLAAVGAPIVAGILSLRIGMRVQLDRVLDATGEIVWAALSPVRTEVLWVEILFWVATALGILAIVLGIIATARRRGRGLGVTAIILAVIGPVGFLLLVSVLFGVGSGIAAAGGV